MTRAFAYAKTWDARLVSLSEGKHRISAWCRVAAPGSTHAAPCSSLLGVSNPGSGCSPGCSSQLCPFPVASCCSSTPAGLSWAACSQTAEAVTSLVPSTKLAVTCSRHCPGPLPSCARGDAEPAACWALLCEDLLPPWGERGQASSSHPSPSPVEPCCCLSAALGHPAGPTPVCRWLSWREGHQCALNCLKVIKGSWVDILNRTFVAFVNL